MKAWVWIWILIASIPCLAGGTDADIRHSIDEILMQRHPKDTAQTWRGLGPSTPKVIVAMATETGHTYVKIRLIQALAYFPEDAAAQAFVKEQGERATDDVIRHAAIRSVGRAQGDAGVEWISQFLDDKNPQTRLTAAEALQRIGTDSARSKVETYLKREKLPWVAKRLAGESVPVAPLKVTGSNEDQLGDDWIGVWKGQWIEVKGASPTRAELKVERKSPTEWVGSLQIFHSKKLESLRVIRAMGKASRATGVIGLQEEAGQVEVSFEAELWSSRQGTAILLKSAARSGVFVGSKL